MDTQTAIDLINEDTSVRFFTFRVSAHASFTHHGVITVLLEWENWETSPLPPLPSGGGRMGDLAFLPGKIRPYRSFDVRVSDIDTHTELLRKVMTLIIDTVTHELREGVRIASEGFYAPFHPHRPEGRERWGDEIGDTALAMGVERAMIDPVNVKGES